MAKDNSVVSLPLLLCLSFIGVSGHLSLGRSFVSVLTVHRLVLIVTPESSAADLPQLPMAVVQGLPSLALMQRLSAVWGKCQVMTWLVFSAD